MFQSVSWCDAHVFVVHQHLAKQVKAFVTNAIFIIVVNEALEVLGFAVLDDLRTLIGEIKSILPQILPERISSHDIDNASQLVVVVRTLEKGVNLKEHSS